MNKRKINKIEYDYIIPLGFNCCGALALNNIKYRNFKLPFDWVDVRENKIDKHKAYIDIIDRYINNNLDFNIDKNDKEDYSIIGEKYIFYMPHEPNEHNIDKVIDNYKKYYNRLINILKQKNKRIMFLITDYYNDKELDRRYIIKDYNEYFNRVFPSNNYSFLTVNMINIPIKSKDWYNIVIRFEPYMVNNKKIDNVDKSWSIIDFYSNWLSQLIYDNFTVINKI